MKFELPPASLNQMFPSEPRVMKVGKVEGVLICVIAPLTQACFNPARDFGPRLVACLAGWGTVALPGPRPTGFLTVYILAPIIGAVAGGGLYTRVIGPALPVFDKVKQPT